MLYIFWSYFVIFELLVIKIIRCYKPTTKKKVYIHEIIIKDGARIAKASYNLGSNKSIVSTYRTLLE